MLIMKNKIKKLKLPLNKMTGDEKNYTAVLLEDMNSNMKAFWEVLSGVKEKGDATFEQVGRITEKIDSMEIKIDSMETRLDSMEGKVDTTNKRLDSMEIKLDDLISAISLIKRDMEALKTSLSAKADKEKLSILEFKIVRIEKYLKLAQ